MSSRKLPVVFAGLAPFMNNKILDRAYMARYPGGESGTVWAKRVIAAGYEFMTIDRYCQDCPNQRALLISDMAAGLGRSRELIPALCASLESPIYANRYYHHLGEKTRRFHKIWDWPGVSERIPQAATRFIPNAWPTTAARIPAHVPWGTRRFMVMVTGNKRAMRWQWPAASAPWRWPRAILANLRTSYIKRADPWMQWELYADRLQAVGYFAKHTDFDLFGSGWTELKAGSELAVADQIRRAFRGRMECKEQEIPRYKFYLCFENTIFPGYLTEKLFDCFFAGVIPIYLGDPDILQRIPAETFIDARRFASWESLDDYCQSLTATAANDYLTSAREFLASDAFIPFTADAFADTILGVLDEVSRLQT